MEKRLSKKSGFTLIEVSVGLVVLSFAALVLATFARATHQLQLEAQTERDGIEQLRANFYSIAGRNTVPATAVLNIGSEVMRYSAQAAESENELQRVLFAAETPNLPTGLWRKPQSSSSTVSSTDSFTLGERLLEPWLWGTPVPLSNLDTADLSNQNVLWISGGKLKQSTVVNTPIMVISGSEFNTDGKTVHLTSANRFTLVYLPEDIPSSSLSKGWYALPSGSDLFASLTTDNRLDVTRYHVSSPNDLSSQQLEELGLLLDTAYSLLYFVANP